MRDSERERDRESEKASALRIVTRSGFSKRTESEERVKTEEKKYGIRKVEGKEKRQIHPKF